jgi:hypothetical protein
MDIISSLDITKLYDAITSKVSKLELREEKTPVSKLLECINSDNEESKKLIAEIDSDINYVRSKLFLKFTDQRNLEVQLMQDIFSEDNYSIDTFTHHYYDTSADAYAHHTCVTVGELYNYFDIDKPTYIIRISNCIRYLFDVSSFDHDCVTYDLIEACANNTFAIDLNYVNSKNGWLYKPTPINKKRLLSIVPHIPSLLIERKNYNVFSKLLNELGSIVLLNPRYYHLSYKYCPVVTAILLGDNESINVVKEAMLTSNETKTIKGILDYINDNIDFITMYGEKNGIDTSSSVRKIINITA